MHRTFLSAVASWVVLSVAPASAQTPAPDLMTRVQAARNSADLGVLMNGAAAARRLGDFEVAAQLLRQADDALEAVKGIWTREHVFQALASGGGVNGMRRALRQAQRQIHLTPVQLAGVINTFPALLQGGEFDELVAELSADHADPGYHCECLAVKAWMHRVAGRDHESRVLWGRLVAAWDRNPLAFDSEDQQADWQARYARNLARAGRMADARAALEKAMSMPVSAEARPAVQRRWAQTYAELGDVERAVGLLEPLIASSTLVTVNSLSTRFTWDNVRAEPAFQEMLARNR